MRNYNENSMKVLNELRKEAKECDFNVDVFKHSGCLFYKGVTGEFEPFREIDERHESTTLYASIDTGVIFDACKYGDMDLSIEETKQALNELKAENPELFNGNSVIVADISGRMYWMNNENDDENLYDLIDSVSEDDILAFEFANEVHRENFGYAIDEECVGQSEVVFYLEKLKISEEFKNLGVASTILSNIEKLLGISHVNTYSVFAVLSPEDNAELPYMIKAFENAGFTVGKFGNENYGACKIFTE